MGAARAVKAPKPDGRFTQGDRTPEDEIAIWFVAGVLHDRYETVLHRRQIDTARALLRAGYSEEEIKGCVRALLRGELGGSDYAPWTPTSLVYLMARNSANGGRSPIQEYTDRSRRAARLATDPHLCELRMRRETLIWTA